MSPLSDTTNLAAGLTGTDLFVHIRHMLFTTVPGVIIALTVYGFLGMKYKQSNIDQESIQQVILMLEKSFVISPWLLLVPVAVIGLVVKKVPAIPALVIGIILGSFAQVVVQGGSLSGAITALQSGYVIETGNEMVDGLFNSGGLDSMMYTVSMTIVAMTFGGILEYSGMLQSMMNQILKLAKSAGSLVASTILSLFCYECNMFRTIHFNCCAFSDVCNCLYKNGITFEKPFPRFRRWWNINVCFHPLEYLWCIYIRNFRGRGI